MKLVYLYRLSLAYLGVPAILFLFTWLRPPFSLLFGGIAIAAFIFFLSRKKQDLRLKQNDGDKLLLTKFSLVLILICSLVICLINGLGGYFPQENDYIARNAYYSDLITHTWPIYSSNGQYALIYYLSFWFIPAAMSKPIYYCFGYEIAWTTGNIILLLWATLGVSIATIWLARIVKIKKPGQVLLLILMFALFDSPIILGASWQKIKEVFYQGNTLYSILWENPFPGISGISAQMGWIFNQAIPIWIVISMMLIEEDIGNYIFLAILCFPYSPFAVVGVVLLFAPKAITILANNWSKNSPIHKNVSPMLFSVFRLQNILAFISVFLVHAFFYASIFTGSSKSEVGSLVVNKIPFSTLTSFYIIEFLLYFVVLYVDHSKDPLYYSALAILFLYPIFLEGNLAMRISIPPMYIIMIYCFSFIFRNMDRKKSNLRISLATMLCVLLILGAITPISVINKNIMFARNNQPENWVKQEYSSSVDDRPEEFYNTVFETPTNSIFFKYLAKKHRPS